MMLLAFACWRWELQIAVIRLTISFRSQKVVSSKIPKDYVVAKLPHVDISKCLDREAKAVQVGAVAGLLPDRVL